MTKEELMVKVLAAAEPAAEPASPVDAAVLRDADLWMKLEEEAVRDYFEVNNIWYRSA